MLFQKQFIYSNINNYLETQKKRLIMSQYDNTNLRPDQNDRSGKNSIRIIGWITIILLSGCCLYLFVSRNRMAAENGQALRQKQQAIDSVKTDRLYLQAGFDAASAKIDMMMSKNVSLT